MASRKMYVLVCKLLGSDIEQKVKEQGHVYKRVEVKGLMPLVIEAWEEEGIIKVSICHYGQLNGDAMRDPEIVAEIRETIGIREGGRVELEKTLYPVYYRNDYLGIEQFAVIRRDGKTFEAKKLINSLTSLLNTWAINIKAQGYIEAAKRQQASTSSF